MTRHFRTTRAMRCLLLAAAVICALGADAAQYSWENVARVVAVGDLHGDYDAYSRVMVASGLIDASGHWSGATTHLVQLGDIADRGPDSTRIIDHLRGLARQARKSGGRVHTLIGNHEAMLIQGDYRYVDPGQYAAFTTPRSGALRDRYFQAYIEALRRQVAKAEWPVFDAAYRNQWDASFPLGFVEHAQAWSPAGRYGKWVGDNPTVIRINGVLFLHGGLSGSYAGMSIEDINARIARELESATPSPGMLVTAEDGPLWYRGLAIHDEADEADGVAHILATHSASRIVIAHTPTLGPIMPRFGSRVIVIDTGISSAYGSHLSYLDISGGVVTVWISGSTYPLPADPEASTGDYLDFVEQVFPGYDADAQRKTIGAPAMTEENR